MAHYLAQGGKRVGHDIGIECYRPEDFINAFKDGMIGTCETGAMLGWRLIRHYLPQVKFVVVRRPMREVLVSLGAFGIIGQEEEMERRDAMLDVIASLPGTLSMDWNALGFPEGGKQLWEFCLDVEWNPEIWGQFNSINIQVDMRQRLAKLHDNHDRLMSLKAEIALRQQSIFKGVSCPILN